MVEPILSGQGDNLLADMLKALKKSKKDLKDLDNVDPSALVGSDAISQISDSVKTVASGQANASRLDASTRAIASRGSTSRGSDSNMMSNNFASGYGAGDSASDALKSVRARKSIDSQEKSRVSALLDDLGGVRVGEDVLTGKDAALHAARAEKRMLLIKKADTVDEAEKVLKKYKKDLDDKAQEAMQPKDENGKPIEDLVTDGPPVEEVSSPVLDAENSAPVLDSDSVSVDVGGSAPVLDSGESVPVDVSVGKKSSSASPHVDIVV